VFPVEGFLVERDLCLGCDRLNGPVPECLEHQLFGVVVEVVTHCQVREVRMRALDQHGVSPVRRVPS